MIHRITSKERTSIDKPKSKVISETRVLVFHHGMKTCERDERRGKADRFFLSNVFLFSFC